MSASGTGGRRGVAVAAWGGLAAALFAPWPFASVEPFWWALAVALVCGFVAVGRTVDLVATRGGGSPLPPAALPPSALAFAILLPCVAALAAVPLPAALVNVIAPDRAGVFAPVLLSEPAGWTSLSLFAPATIDALLLAAACAALAWSLADATTDERSRSRLFTAFVAGGVLIAVFGLVQRIFDPHPQRMFFSVEIWEVGTPFGPYVNRNHFGGAMLLFLGAAIGLATRARVSGRRPAFVGASVAAAVIAVALLATTSRGAVVGCVALLGVLLLATPARARLRMTLACCGLAIVALGGLLAAGLLDDLTDRLFRLYGRWRNRFLVQADAVGVFARFPVAGTGAGTFPWVFHVFQEVEDARHFSDAHSDWAQFLMETGLVGVAYAVSLVAALARRVRSAATADSPDRWLAIGGAAGLAGIAAHGFVETNLHIPANALLAAAAVGLSYGAAVAVRRAAPNLGTERADES